MKLGIKVYMYWEISIRMRRWRIGNGSQIVHVLGNIYQNEAVENMKLGLKVNMCK